MLKVEQAAGPVSEVPVYPQCPQPGPATDVQGIQRPHQGQALDLGDSAQLFDKGPGETLPSGLKGKIRDPGQLRQALGHRQQFCMLNIHLKALHAGKTPHKAHAGLTHQQVGIQLQRPDMGEIGLQCRQASDPVQVEFQIEVRRRLTVAVEPLAPTRDQAVADVLAHGLMERLSGSNLPLLQCLAQPVQFALPGHEKVIYLLI